MGRRRTASLLVSGDTASLQVAVPARGRRGWAGRVCGHIPESPAVPVASGKAAPSVDSVTKGGRPLPEQRHFDPVTENRESRRSPALTHGPAAGRAFDVLGLSTHRVTISRTPSG